MVMLRWWFIAVVQLAGLAALFVTGIARKLWAVDVTKLGVVLPDRAGVGQRFYRLAYLPSAGTPLGE